jgi:hypothetical protein
MLKRDESIPPSQLQYVEPFSYGKTGFGVALLCGASWAAIAIARKAGRPDDWREHGLMLVGLSSYTAIVITTTLFLIARARMLFDRATATGRYWRAHPFNYKTKSMDMREFVECFVCGIKQDDETALYYSLRLNFKDSADVEIDMAAEPAQLRALADEINQFWGVSKPQRETIIIDQQAELRKWAEKH